MILRPKIRDLGDISVERLLPAAGCRSIGPFVFIDHIGPATFPAGRGIDVRPHPHIGLETVTYLFEGAILHRDSLGMVQPIRPGDVNWMTAGHGIVHSERTPEPERENGHRLHGMQLWVALPDDSQGINPAFSHHPASDLPEIRIDGAIIRLIAGDAYGLRSPVTINAPLFYCHVVAEAGATFTAPTGHAERAVYPVDFSISVDDQPVPAGHLLVLDAAAPGRIEAPGRANIMLLGGDPLHTPRIMWWNLVHTDQAVIDKAKADWKAGRFPTVPGETEFIPLPDQGTAQAPDRAWHPGTG